jgi:hypothetical protein
MVTCPLLVTDVVSMAGSLVILGKNTTIPEQREELGVREKSFLGRAFPARYRAKDKNTATRARHAQHVCREIKM